MFNSFVQSKNYIKETTFPSLVIIIISTSCFPTIVISARASLWSSFLCSLRRYLHVKYVISPRESRIRHFHVSIGSFTKCSRLNNNWFILGFGELNHFNSIYQYSISVSFDTLTYFNKPALRYTSDIYAIHF